MAKLKDKAGCSETELIEECWEAADEVLGKKSCAIIGEALTGSTKETKPDPFAKVAEKYRSEAPRRIQKSRMRKKR